MATPVLSKKQLRNSLSAKKTPLKGIRNVLAQPYENYWPLVSPEKCPDLEDLLKKLGPAIKRPALTIPWSQLRHMKREERAQAKKEALLKQEKLPDKDIVSSVVAGINAVTRALEKGNLCCVLLEPNVEPTLLVKHIVLMAENKKIPILLLPELKSITLNSIGFPSAAFALKNVVMESSDHHFHLLYKSILDIFKDLPPPKKSQQLFKDFEISNDSALNDSEMVVENDVKHPISESNKMALPTDVYKYRSSCRERAFIPPGSKDDRVAEKIDSDEFISISHFSDAEMEDEEDTKIAPQNRRYIETGKNSDVKYVPLKVKRLQGNSNRTKATKISKQKRK